MWGNSSVPTTGVINVDRLEGVSKRLLRVLFASAALAAAWVAIDLATHAAPAAAEVVDLLPNGDDQGVVPFVASVIDPAVQLAAPAVAPIASAVAEPLAPVLEPVQAVVDEVAAPVVTDTLTPVLTGPLAPIVNGAVLPIVQVLPVVATVVETVVSAQDPAMWIGRELIVGGGLLLGGALASSLGLSVPTPTNGGQRRQPFSPALPSGAFAGMLALLGELNSGIPTAIGAVRTSAPPTRALPSSPTYASDTTPD